MEYRSPIFCATEPGAAARLSRPEMSSRTCIRLLSRNWLVECAEARELRGFKRV